MRIHHGREDSLRWNRVEECLRAHPHEASNLDEFGRFLLNAVLARKMDDYPSVDIVKAFVEAYPPVIWGSSNIGGIPLEVACWRRAPLDILQLLVESRPSMPHDSTALNTLWNQYSIVFERNGISLVDFVCEGGREAGDIWTKLYMLLRYCTDPRTNVSTWRGLHLASSSPTCPLGLFKLMLQLNRGEAQKPDENGRLPLHCLASGVDKESLEDKLALLLKANPSAVQKPDNNGLLPIHAAVIAGHSIEFIDALIAASPDSLGRRGGSNSLFPFQLASISPHASVSLLYHLIRAAPHFVLDDPVEEPTSLGMEESEDELTVAPVLSKIDRDAIFTDLVDLVAHSRGPKAWKEMLKLLRNHEGHCSAPWRVVHASASITTLYPSFLELAVRLHPEDLKQKDEAGRLPLHIVSSLDPHPFFARGQEEDRQLKINTILQGFPQAAKVSDNTGSLPIHRAITAGQSWSSLSSLVLAAPETLCRRDGVSKLYPFQLAACSPSAQLNELYLLLVSAPHILAPQTN